MKNIIFTQGVWPPPLCSMADKCWGTTIRCCQRMHRSHGTKCQNLPGDAHICETMVEVRALWEDLHYYVSSDRPPRLFFSLYTTGQVLLGRPSGTVGGLATPSFSCNGLLYPTVAPHTLAFSTVLLPSFTRKPSALAKPAPNISMMVGTDHLLLGMAYQCMDITL